MIPVADLWRRAQGRMTHRLRVLPILALNVHTACNCRCVMCDIWKANAEGRELSPALLDRHLDSIRRLRVRRVMLTGGEPLLHRNLWALCDRLRDHGIGITLVTTGLLIDAHLDALASRIDDLVVSIDGPAEIHDAIRRVPGGFRRLAVGLQRLAAAPRRPRIIARAVVQRANHAFLLPLLRAVDALGVDGVSCLAADVSSTAFNRREPWSPDRRSEIALSSSEVLQLARAIREVESAADLLARRFVEGGIPSLWRIHDYYRALAGDGAFPPTRCNAPWVSAVLGPDGDVRPCFFHAPYPHAADLPLDEALNTADAVAFRRELDVTTNATCRRCVCTFALPPWMEVAAAVQ